MISHQLSHAQQAEREGVFEFELTSVLCGVRTRQKFTCVNKIETMYDMSRGNIN